MVKNQFGGTLIPPEEGGGDYMGESLATQLWSVVGSKMNKWAEIQIGIEKKAEPV